MDYFLPTVLIGIGVLGVKEHLEISKMKKQIACHHLYIEQTKHRDNLRCEADKKMVEELKKLSLLH